MAAIGTRAQRAAVASAITSAAGNMLEAFGSDPDSGYYDEIKDLPWPLVAAITADLLKNLPGDSWDARVPQPGTRPEDIGTGEPS